jgi:hypothetical protein
MQKSIIATFCPCDILSLQRFVHATFCPCDVLSMRRIFCDVLSATFCPRHYVRDHLSCNELSCDILSMRHFVRNDLSATICPATFCPVTVKKCSVNRLLVLNPNLNFHRSHNSSNKIKYRSMVA